MPIEQAAQMAAAILVLIAFVLAQFGRWRTQGWSYLLFNFIGSAILATDAWAGSQWGFVLLEGVWALVSLWSIVARLRTIE